MRIVHPWLAELVEIPSDPSAVAEAIALRGFEVASVEPGALPVIDFEITANRPDCLSHLGIAREAAVIWNVPLRPAVWRRAARAVEGSTAVDVDIQEPELCTRYCAQVFEVTIGPSPAWLADRLQAAGIRPINAVVDVTNYVLLELGQPMHAFDLERLAGGRIVVRRARQGEKLRSLDGADRTLDDGMLVIADGERATAIAGVMGGAESEIAASTSRIVLESAYFEPRSVRRTSRRLGLKTEASTRFERGGDEQAPPAGIARAAALFEQIGAGRAIGPLVDRYPAPSRPREIRLRPARLARLLGTEVPAAEVPRILAGLGFEVAGAEDGWRVRVPSFRVDVAREADLVEEVGRHYGFDRIPSAFPALAAPQPAPALPIGRERLLRQVLSSAGFSEAMTFAFIEREAALPFCAEGREPAAIANPLSEKYAVLRPSLLPGLIDACVHNRRRARRDVQLFETGSRFHPERGEGRAAAIVWSGAADGPHWSGAVRQADFFDVKGVVEKVCAIFGVEPEFSTGACTYLAPGRTADVHVGKGNGRTALGVAGQLAPQVAEARGFPPAEEIYVAEIDLGVLFEHARGDDVRAAPLPRYPSIVRDVSILVPEALPAAAVRGTIRSSAPSTLVAVSEFDRYSGKGVPEQQVSLSLRLTFRAPDRTLTDEDVQAAMDGIVDALKRAHGALQR